MRLFVPEAAVRPSFVGTPKCPPNVAMEHVPSQQGKPCDHAHSNIPGNPYSARRSLAPCWLAPGEAVPSLYIVVACPHIFSESKIPRLSQGHSVKVTNWRVFRDAPSWQSEITPCDPMGTSLEPCSLKSINIHFSSQLLHASIWTRGNRPTFPTWEPRSSLHTWHCSTCPCPRGSPTTKPTRTYQVTPLSLGSLAIRWLPPGQACRPCGTSLWPVHPTIRKSRIVPGAAVRCCPRWRIPICPPPASIFCTPTCCPGNI